LERQLWRTGDDLDLAPFPGASYSAFAVGALSDSDIILAGGRQVGEFHDVVEAWR
jgi:hypothetical protein